VPELTPTEARAMDKVLETQLALWSALLAVEGLFLAIAPLLTLLASRQVLLYSVVLVATAVIAGVLLVWNFISAREAYL